MLRESVTGAYYCTLPKHHIHFHINMRAVYRDFMYILLCTATATSAQHNNIDHFIGLHLFVNKMVRYANTAAETQFLFNQKKLFLH